MSKNYTKYTNSLEAERNRDIKEKAANYSKIRENEAKNFNIKEYFEGKYFRKNLNRMNDKEKKKFVYGYLKDLGYSKNAINAFGKEEIYKILGEILSKQVYENAVKYSKIRENEASQKNIYNYFGTKHFKNNISKMNDVSKNEFILEYVNNGRLTDLIHSENLRNAIGPKIIDEILRELYSQQKIKYPKIAETFEENRNNIYYLLAHGSIIPNEYFFVPKNVSIILNQTPGESVTTYMNKMAQKHMSADINQDYLNHLLPGISYFPVINNKIIQTNNKNQLRFFKSGDLINNIDLDFNLAWENNNTQYPSGIIKFVDSLDEEYIKLKRKYSNNAYINKHHIKEGNISWPEINSNNFETDLREIILKFKNKRGHFVLIVGTCLYETKNALRRNLLTAPAKKKKNNISQITDPQIPFYKLGKSKLQCFQDLSTSEQFKDIKRIGNLSSTRNLVNCYQEILNKLRLAKKKKELFKNKINIHIFDESIDSLIEHLKNIYKNSSIIENKFLISILNLFPKIQNVKNERRQYKNKFKNINEKNIYQIPNTNNIPFNMFKNNENSQEINNNNAMKAYEEAYNLGMKLLKAEAITNGILNQNSTFLKLNELVNLVAQEASTSAILNKGQYALTGYFFGKYQPVKNGLKKVKNGNLNIIINKNIGENTKLKLIMKEKIIEILKKVAQKAKNTVDKLYLNRELTNTNSTSNQQGRTSITNSNQQGLNVGNKIIFKGKEARINSINNNYVTLSRSNNRGGEKISIPINNLRNKIQKGGYINIKKYGRRKIRYYKNGNPYVIINGKKKKI